MPSLTSPDSSESGTDSTDPSVRSDLGLSVGIMGADRLQEISTHLIRQTTLPQLLAAILGAAIEISEADFGNVQMYDRASKSLSLVAHSGFQQDFLAYFASVKDSKAACGSAMHAKQRIIVQDVATSPIYDEEARDVMLRAEALACQSTPLLGRNEELLGILSTHYRKPKIASERSLRSLDLLARVAADLIERMQSDSALRTVARLAAKGELASAMAHEINNLLQALANILTLLAADSSVPERPKKLVDMAKEELNRVSAIVNQLLTFTSVHTGVLSPPVNVQHTLNDELKQGE